ncbi:MAG: DEAD/DEAH box helicase [Nitrospinaceae bacterium]|nr:DEAD/DEAH box helicase [Nitrospinaceae bacterium]NIR55769.1 DEAD/DEAH box helicase [Nitrospinaceae bacterium]NIS86217.1 DEAD/DEAH box helicase [Nitrospinaceae bacterium]NIT83052.1 DEAD/DEAH box helicase [Nitrospinaceae bacterium]NIU45262.1 DEAD/DEAH box helicase [Nitrospinaceae bacterium]
MDVAEMKTYFEAQGVLSRKLAAFEFRPQQVTMAEKVASALERGSHLMVEAGTGTGKSLAYLIPAVLWAVQNDARVVVSTYTKTLQEQILHHDLPFLRDTLGLNFRYSLCLGSENYLSLRRMKRASQTRLFGNVEEDEQLNEIFQWAGRTESGFRNDLPFEPMPSVWEEVGRQKDLCMGKHCESFNACFYFKERRKWFGAHLLIVNHHLFFANVANNGAVLPRFDAVVFDEAQNLEEAATSFLGLEVSNSGLIYFLDRLYNPKTKRGTLTRLREDVTVEIRQQVSKVRVAAEGFFQNLLDEYGRKERTLRFYHPPTLNNTLYIPMQDLYEALKALEHRVNSEEEHLEITAAANRVFEYNNTLSALLNHNMKEYVYWLEVSPRKRFTRAMLRGVPINIDEELKEQVFSKIERVVMTSATLTTDRKFDHIKERLGCEPEDEAVLDSPFDFQKQALLYIPRDLPEPGAKLEAYVSALAGRTRQLIQATGGKTFVLFTSYDLLNRVFEILDPLLQQYPLFRQGDMANSRMIQRFKEKPSVIFGTSSFWQGVDIPGEALSSVIITKLPFDVPTEPLVEARIEDLKKRAINPFRHYQVPRAIIQLRQGFGRLIRKRTDKGIVAILDSRMTNRNYGRQFLNSLPDCARTQDLQDVQAFLANGIENSEGD